MKTLSLILCLVGLIGLSGLVVGAQAPSGCNFPGTNRTCQDPRGRWVIEWREPISGGHVLWLYAVSGGPRRKLLEFTRSVELMWSPDGQALAVTDRAGSSDSALRVYRGATLMRAINVEDRLIASLGKLPAIFNNGHRYFEAVDWVSPDVLRFRVRAYDSDPSNEFVGTFRYNLAGRVSREPSK